VGRRCKGRHIRPPARSVRLIRTGVAPDHQSIKGVSRRYEQTALSDNVRFVGNVTIGQDVSIEELGGFYDAVVLATGAPRDRPLDLPGDRLGNVFGSAAFVGWYNGHPEFTSLAPDLSGETAVVIGMGNVALDVARILSKTRDEFAGSDIVAHALDALDVSKLRRIVILGRRGPHQIMMTPRNWANWATFRAARPWSIRKTCRTRRGCPAGAGPAQIRQPPARLCAQQPAGADIAIEFDFFAAPRALLGNGKVEAIEVERTRIEDGRAVGTGAFYELPASLVVSCIGYRTVPVPGVPFDERAGRFANDEGRILPGLYCVGWARRGPSGTIGTNRPDGSRSSNRSPQT
jgi:ferredoxin--NADP+ reductase